MRSRLSLLLLLFSLVTFSQTLEKLKSDAKKICDANYNMDFDVVTNLTYPKIYEASGKAAFAEKLDSEYENSEYRMRIEIAEPLLMYSEMKTVAGKKFYIITYKNPVRYFFEAKLDAAAASEKAASLKISTLSNDVTFEPKRNSFNVRRNSKLIAVSDENTNGEWRFINFDDSTQRQFFETAFASDVKKALGF